MAAIKGWIIYFNPHSPRGERLHHTDQHPDHGMISIHAPRGGSDLFRRCRRTWNTDFNPRSPRGERHCTAFLLERRCVFQSTLPAGGATGTKWYESVETADFNPRSPRGERQAMLIGSVHPWAFQSTLPAGGATNLFDRSKETYHISIHAPRGGSDSADPRGKDDFHISIHAPRGGSDSTVKTCSNDRIKRSTLREPHFLYSKNACFSPISPLCATTSRTINQRIIVSFGSYPGLAPMCFTLDWYRFPRL